jgi:hypothetical protein
MLWIEWGQVDEYSRLFSATVSYNVLVRSVPYSRQPLSRVLGYNPPMISAGLKRVICSVALAVPCGLIATGLSDSTAISSFLRYAVSPGTALAVRVVRVEPSHRGPGVFLDALHWYGAVMSFAFLVNAILYGLFIFGAMTITSALTTKNFER